MKTWIFFSLLAGRIVAQDAGIKKNQPVLGVAPPDSRAPPGGVPAGCIRSYNGPAFKLAALALDQQVNGPRIVGEGAEEVASASNSGDHSGDTDGSRLDDGVEHHVKRRALRLGKAFRRQAQPSETDVLVTSRTTRTSTATITVSPGAVQTKDDSWTKTVYGATVDQAPNGQVQVVETPVPIVLQPKGTTKPTPSAPLPASVPRLTQAANGQVQASKESKAPKAVVRGAFVVREEASKKTVQGETLELSLKDGILKDKHGRTGYLSGARQFQFDNPPQRGALVTAGFAVCEDGLLALGPSRVFYQCKSGTIFNLYDQKIAGQCSPINLLFFEEYIDQYHGS